MKLGGDNLHRNVGLGGVLRKEMGDDGYRALVVELDALRRIVGPWGQIALEVGVDGTGESVRDVRDGRHDVADVLLGR